MSAPSASGDAFFGRASAPIDVTDPAPSPSESDRPSHPTDDDAQRTSTDAAKTPRAFRETGRVVCLAEELRARFGAAVDPVHDHLYGFRVDAKNGPRYFTLVRTPHSEALFVDERFRKHSLVLSGRIFPGSQLLEVSGWLWIRDGVRYDVYYWCEVCAIRGVDPGPCACCQGEVELREKAVDRAAR